MAHFNDLPAEIVDCIISFTCMGRSMLSVVEDQPHPTFSEAEKSRRQCTATLLSLCLTSKKICGLTEPHLYRSWEPLQYDEWTDAQQRSLQNFLINIIHRPDLANHVQHIGALSWRIKNPGDDDNLLTADQIKLFHNAAKNDALPELDEWLGCLKAGSADPLIALLLSLTPNLRSVFFGVPHGSSFPRDVFGEAVDWTDAPGCGAVGRLQKISYRGVLSIDSSTEEWITFNEVLPFFFFPTMKTFRVTNCWDPYDPLELDEHRKRIYYPLPNRASSINHIALESSQIKPRIIEGIVRACRNLETLSISYDLDHYIFLESPDLSRQLAVLNPPKLREALASVRHSLQSLKFHIALFTEYDDQVHLWREPVIQPFGSLRDFENLSMLDVGLVMLLGNKNWENPRLVDVLPPSLAMLRLRDDDEIFWYNWGILGLHALLLGLATDSPELLPKLSLVDISYVDGASVVEDDDFEHEKVDIDKAFADAGISLSGAWWA